MGDNNLDLLAIVLYGGLATPTQWLGGPNAQILKDAANAITSLTQQLAEANARVEGKWVSVEERLPATMIPVLTTNGKRVTQTYRTSDDASRWGAWPPNAVTYWKPLPAPPRKEK